MTTGMRAGFYYFAIIFAVGFVLGVLRTIALVTFPNVSPLSAVIVELPIILFIAWMVCGRLVARLNIAHDVVATSAMGVTALVLLLSAEAGLSVGLNGLSLQEHISLYNQTSHVAGLVGQLAFAVMPLVKINFG
jgi:hypothetical protein